MAIMIREYLGHEGFKVDWNNNITESASMVEFAEKMNSISPNSLMVQIEGIHVGPTRNYTWYTEQALRGSVPTWTKPYQRPLIMHHNEKDGKIIGRITYVDYTDKNTRSNTGALLFTANVPDKEGKEGIENGTLKTVSIGVIVHDARCSICGHNIAEEGPCDHERGVKYGDKICYWMIYSMEAKELSYVIVPSDIYAHNIQYYKPQQSDLKESSKGVLDLSEATKIDPVTGLPVQEGQVIDENGNKPAEQTPPAAPTVDVEALNAEIERLKNANKTLEGEVETLKADKKAAEDAKDIAVKELGDTKVLLDQAQKSLGAVQATLTAKESELSTAISLREAAETQVMNIKTELKESLIDKVAVLRSALGKPIVATEELAKRSEDSLKDAVNDLKEEMAKPADVTKITLPQNPTITEKTEEAGKGSVKEDKKQSNIDLAEGLENIFNSLMGSKKFN